MQVTQVSDHVTHAVIGGHNIIDFGVAQDAELMNVLSKALYTDQILAVVRETLCNAWDEHVKAGITDKPIDVTLTKDELTIRDYGNGIPFKLIGPIYGTYGGSTKKHDGKQTGGFGLGCKSPFAYGDHFEVTSWSTEDGKMTVYQMSKSNAEIGGKPGIVPVVSVPTTEQGLQVKVKIQEKDRMRFDTLICRIIQNGEMNVNYNGDIVDVIPFKEMKHNFFITESKLIETQHQVLLRYGHVVYPIEDTAEFTGEFARVKKILSNIPNQHGSRNNREFKIVFQAKPHTISITPSREALSMQPHTIQAIKELLGEFLVIAEARLESGCHAILSDSIRKTWLTGSPKLLFETFGRIPNMKVDRGIIDNITDYPQFIERYASYTYPDYKDFFQKDWQQRVDALIDSGFGDTELIKTFKAELTKNYGDPSYGVPRTVTDPKDKTKYITTLESPRTWFDNHIKNPLVTALMKNPAMHHEKLFVYMNERERYGDVKLYGLNSIPKGKAIHFWFPWVRKIVILAHNRTDFAYRAEQFPVMKHWLGKVENSFLYTVARSPKRVAEATKFWEEQGYTILDLTKAQPWEEQDVAAPIQREYTARAKRKGLPMLSSAYDKNAAGFINMKAPSEEETNLIESPDFVWKYNPKSEHPNLPGMSNSISRWIIEKWGKQGGFVVNMNQETKYLTMGAKTYFNFLLEKILHELKNNPRIIKSLPFLWDRDKTIMTCNYGRFEYKREHLFLSAVYADKDLYEYFGIVQDMTTEDKRYLQMMKEIEAEYPDGLYRDPHYLEIKKHLDGTVTDKKVIELFDLIRKSIPLMAMDGDKTVSILNGQRTGVTKEHRTLVRDMLLQAIEG